MHDLWLLGDAFLEDIYAEYLTRSHTSEKDNKSSTTSPFMRNYFNVKKFTKIDDSALAITHVINALIEAINMKDARIPKMLVVVLDKDILNDIDQGLSFMQATTVMTNLVCWVVRQITTIIRRKKTDLLEKRPGVVSGFHTKIICVCILHHVGHFHEESKIHNICQLRAKFNDALNDAVAKVDHYIMTITICNQYQHYDKLGKLSMSGKGAFWAELDDLLQKFEADRIKLLPNLKNSARSAFCDQQYSSDDNLYDEYFTSGYRSDNGFSHYRNCRSPLNPQHHHKGRKQWHFDRCY